MWWWLSLLLTLCPGVLLWLCDTVGTMGWAEAARTQFRGKPLCVKCWCCLQQDSACHLEGGPSDAFWPSAPLSWRQCSGSQHLAAIHPSFLTPGKLLGRVHVAVMCVPPAPGDWTNLLNLAVLGGSREDTETAVQPPGEPGYSVFWQSAARLSSSLRPVQPRAAHPECLTPGRASTPPPHKDWLTPQAKIHCKEKFSKKIQSLPETQAECSPRN